MPSSYAFFSDNLITEGTCTLLWSNTYSSYADTMVFSPVDRIRERTYTCPLNPAAAGAFLLAYLGHLSFMLWTRAFKFCLKPLPNLPPSFPFCFLLPLSLQAVPCLLNPFFSSCLTLPQSVSPFLPTPQIGYELPVQGYVP